MGFSALISWKSIAQITFTEQNASYSSLAVGIISGDFDEDGHIDLAYGDSEDAITVQLGNGDGTFNTRSALTIHPGTAINVQSYALDQADLDNDGHIDLFITAAHTDLSTFVTTNNISVLYGNGDGTFDPVVYYTSNNTPHAHAADMDNDGDIDIVGSQEIFYNNGTGTRTFTAVAKSNLSHWDFQIADINSDSYLDVVGVGLFFINISLGSSGGTFTTSTIYVDPNLPEVANLYLTGIQLIDINDDSNLDIVASNRKTPASSTDYYHLYTYYGNGTGSFSTRKRYYLGSLGDIGSITSGDFNQDGLQDIVASHNFGDGFYILQGKCTGDFNPPVYRSRTGSTNYWYLLTSADFNEDGSDDFAGADEGSVYISDNTDGVSVTIQGAVPSLLCPGISLNLPFCASGSFTAGNVFTAQLSNSSGSFASPTDIGTLTSTTGGNIEIVVPYTATAGTGYRVRIVSSTPNYASFDNGSDIQIPAIPAAPVIPTAFLEFDGTDDQVTVAHNTAYNTSGTGSNLYFTIEAWIKTSVTGEATIYSKRLTGSTGFWFGLDANGYLAAETPVSFATSGSYDDQVTSLADGEWHHVAVVRTGSGRNLEFYVDGVLVKLGRSTAANQTTSFNSTHDIWIGNDDAGNDPFNGGIKGIRYWKKALTDTDIYTYWKTNINKYTDPALVGYWDMNDASGQTQTDQSNTANNGYRGNSASSDSRDPLINTTNPVPYTINAILLDGADDRVTIPNLAAYNLGTGGFTIEAWIKANASFNDQTIFARRNLAKTGLWFGLDGLNSNQLALEIGGTRILSSSIDLGVAEWKHVSVTRSGGGAITFYVDGVACGTGTSSTTVNVTHDIWIGNDEQSSFGFGGLIDEVRFWNEALTQNDIFTNKRISNVNCLNSADLIGFWRFNASSGQDDQDLSVKANDALLGTSSSVEITDPLRIADAAFSGARKGVFVKNSADNATKQSAQINIYPNPFSGVTSIVVDNLESDQASYSILTPTGIEVASGNIIEGEKLTFGSTLDAGIYILKITDEGNTQTSRLVKY